MAHVHGFIQDLRSHVALGSLPGISGHIDLTLRLHNGKTKIGNAALKVSFDENILALDITVSNGWFGHGSVYLCVQVAQAIADTDEHAYKHLWWYAVLIEVVVEGPVGVVLGDEPQLCNAIIGHHIAGKESKDVLVT